MERIWGSLYEAAKKNLVSKEVSDYIMTGNTSCAILGHNNKIYSGSSITSNSIISCSAEKSAIINMFNDHEYVIDKIVVLNELEEIIMPSESSLEYLLELNPNYGDIEVLESLEKDKVLKMMDIIPKWWGTYRNRK